LCPVVATFEVPIKGIGKPDYSREVNSAISRAGFYLKFNQQLVVFGVLRTNAVPHPYLVPWVQPLLAPGAQSHLYNLATGVTAPYTIPAGYSLSMIERSWSFTEDACLRLYFDGLLYANPGVTEAGFSTERNPVFPYSTLLIDPTALSAHAVDVIITNYGAGNMEGACTFACILEAMGTPPFPDTKECECPFCHHLQIVKIGTTAIICAKCSQPYFVGDFSTIRKL
jgi:hypothetical protein